MSDGLRIQPEIETALAAGGPVVALESTVISHGLPYPANVETAWAMEASVRAGGGVPATIGIIRGEIYVGLGPEQVEHLARQPAGVVRKCSRRDLPLVVAQQGDGATTVAATMIIAHRAGIELFATGGIGGVHRGHPFDVSADLMELGRTPVTVVCSGVKSILDIAATREVLETQGVPILGYQSDQLPAFYTRDSGFPVDARLEDAAAAAAIIAARRQLTLHSGTLITVPVPAAAALPPAAAEAAIRQATLEADAAGVQGAAATPWLLRRLVALTDGASLEANTALLRHNGQVAGEIAAALSRLA